MNLKYLLSILLLLPLGISAQDRHTLSGYIRDAATGEDLIGASVLVKNKPGTGVTANVYGYYSLTLPEGEHTLLIKFIGFEPKEFTIDLQEDTRRNIELQEESLQLEEVVVSSEREDANVSETAMSREKLPIETIKALPALLGEVDVLRTIQLLPGVQTAGEGTTGLFVRGGSADQNLVLLDEATVYNASHLLGFFSVFNPDAIKNLELYKGGIPARFGGRLSSILDIQMKEGNNKEYEVNGGIGLISSRLTVEGPIQKNRSSFIVSGRRTYADVFLRLSPDENINQNQLYFYDFNAKANLILDENNRIYMSGYFGRDKLGFDNIFGLDWGNTTFTTRWNHLFNNRLFLNTSLIYSRFSYGFEGDDGTTEFRWDTRTREGNLKLDFTYYSNTQHTLTFGASSIYRYFGAPEVSFDSPTEFTNVEVPDRFALETALYIGDEWTVNSRLALEYGLRYSFFQNLGPTSYYLYEEGEPRDEQTVIGTQNYGRFEPVASYHGPEPRLGMKYELTTESSVKASYNRMRQYIQVASNATAGLPIDRWIPADKYVEPLLADQVALGYFRNFKENTFETSAEVYYKWMDQLIDFKLGEQGQILFSDALEREILSGEGRAYGLELLAKKNRGNTTGWVGYTLSRTEREIPGINEGNVYPARYDRTHDLSVVLSHKFTDRFSVSGSFIYSTGLAVSLPSGKYEVDGFIVPVYDDSKRNNYRMPDTHRLDLSATLINKPKPDKRFQGSWTFSIYNAYARKNPFAITFEQVYNNDPNFDPDEGQPVTNVEAKAVQLTLFSIIPSVTYNFKWKSGR